MRIARLPLAPIMAVALAVAPQAGAANADPQIVGGTRVSTATHGYAVFLTDGNGFQFCGGTLVAPDKVVTAAHCVAGRQPGALRVVAGRDDKESRRGVTAGVTDLWVHGGFTGVESGADVAVLTLGVRLGYRTATVPPAGAPHRPGTSATILGWGRTAEGGRTSRYLLAADLPLVADTACAQAYRSFSASSMICAGYPQGGVDTCQGDSGGPMLVGTTLVGIASWGEGCARPGRFGVYTRVSSYTEEIRARL